MRRRSPTFTRADGWTEARRRELLRLLAAGSSVTGAAATLGLSRQSLYRRFRKPVEAAFRAAVAAAIDAAKADHYRHMADVAAAARSARRNRPKASTSSSSTTFPAAVSSALAPEKQADCQADADHHDTDFQQSFRQHLQRPGTEIAADHRADADHHRFAPGDGAGHGEHHRR
jgi:hypothetical protein